MHWPSLVNYRHAAAAGAMTQEVAVSLADMVGLWGGAGLRDGCTGRKCTPAYANASVQRSARNGAGVR